MTTCVSLPAYSVMQDRPLVKKHSNDDVVFPRLSILVTIKKLNHYIHSTNEELQIDCKAHGMDVGEDFNINLYFCSEDKYHGIMSILTEGSTWFVSGTVSIVDGYITIFDPDYSVLNKAQTAQLL